MTTYKDRAYAITRDGKLFVQYEGDFHRDSLLGDFERLVKQHPEHSWAFTIDGKVAYQKDATVSPEARLIADYADLGVSCGYIGGVHMGPVRDDRSFRVFTKLQPCVRRGDERRESFSVVVFDVPRSHTGVWAEAVVFDTPAVRARLDAFRARVAAGELFVPKAAA